MSRYAKKGFSTRDTNLLYEYCIYHGQAFGC